MVVTVITVVECLKVSFSPSDGKVVRKYICMPGTRPLISNELAVTRSMQAVEVLGQFSTAAFCPRATPVRSSHVLRVVGEILVWLHFRFR